MRHQRRPSAGASYRCSLTLSDEAFSQYADFLPGFDERGDLLSNMSDRSSVGKESNIHDEERKKERETYPSLSSKSLGIVISSTRSMRLLADSSSREIDECFLHCSNEGSARKEPNRASSLITG